MPQDPFLLPPGDAGEPDGCPLPPAAEEDGPEGMGQGLYVCLPAGQVTLAGFAQGGEADTMTPGPLLAGIVDTVTARTAGAWRGVPMISCWGSSPRPGGWPPARRGRSWPPSPRTRPGTAGRGPPMSSPRSSWALSCT